MTYRFSYAPHGPDDWFDIGVTGGRRKALTAVRKLFPDRTDWKFMLSISSTGFVRK